MINTSKFEATTILLTSLHPHMNIMLIIEMKIPFCMNDQIDSPNLLTIESTKYNKFEDAVQSFLETYLCGVHSWIQT